MHLCKSRDDKRVFPAIQDALLGLFLSEFEMSRHLIAHGSRLQALSPDVWRPTPPFVSSITKRPYCGGQIAPGLGLLAVSPLLAGGPHFSRSLSWVFKGHSLPKTFHEIAAMVKPGNSSMMSTSLSYTCLHRYP
jgi:hypothetical protein